MCAVFACYTQIHNTHPNTRTHTNAHQHTLICVDSSRKFNINSKIIKCHNTYMCVYIYIYIYLYNHRLSGAPHSFLTCTHDGWFKPNK